MARAKLSDVDLAARRVGMGQLQELIGRIEQTLTPADDFDAARAARTFVLCTTDLFELTLLPPLCERLAREAPGLRLEVRPVGDKRVGPELAAGAIDLAIGPMREPTAGINRQLLYEEALVCAVRADHPEVPGALDTETFARLGHVLVSSRGGSRGHIDHLLAERGLSRRIALCTPHMMVALAVAARTDLCATVAERLAESMAPTLGLRVLPLPVALPKAAHALLWHERLHRDPGHRWLRRALVEICQPPEG